MNRRTLWNLLNATARNRAVLLTTHSMEECEALCQRIGILVSGQLKCLGSSQHLKSRFGKGFQLDISTAGNSVTQAQYFIKRQFPNSEELECYGNKLKYKINETGLKLRDIFVLIEQNKQEAGISEYSVGQTTLEQIFIYFAKKGDDQPDLLGLRGDSNNQRAPSVFISPALQLGAGLPQMQSNQNNTHTNVTIN